MNKFLVVCICLLVSWLCFFNDDYCAKLVGVLFAICFSDTLYAYYKYNIIRFFDLKNYFLIQYFYIFGIGYYSYLSRVNLGLNVYKHSYSLISHSMEISIVSILILLLFYHIVIGKSNIIKRLSLICRFNNKRHFTKLNNLTEGNWRKLQIYIFLLFCIFWLLMGVVPILTPGFHESGRQEYGKGLGVIETMAKCLLSLSSVFYIWKLKTKGHFDKSTLAFFLFCMCIFVLNDERGSLVFYIINIALIYYICKGPIPLKTYILGLICVIFIAGGIGVIRKGDGDNNIARIGVEVATETSVEFDNYVETFKMFKNKDYLYGSTIVPIFTIPIPRLLFPDKDKFKTAGEFFKEYHGHDHIRVGERLTYIGELYMNWGYFGIAVGMALLGIILGSVVKWSAKINRAIYIYVYISIIGFSIGLITGDIATAVVGFITNNIFVWLYILIKRGKVI